MFVCRFVAIRCLPIYCCCLFGCLFVRLNADVFACLPCCCLVDTCMILYVCQFVVVGYSCTCRVVVVVYLPNYHRCLFACLFVDLLLLFAYRIRILGELSICCWCLFICLSIFRY